METKNKFLKLAAISLLALSVSSCNEKAPESQEGTDAQSTPDPIEKCYGISKKGKNDCANALGKHGCAGQSDKDFDPCEWQAVKKSVCDANQGTTEPVNCKKPETPEAK